jgi:hypothetical protein
LDNWLLTVAISGDEIQISLNNDNKNATKLIPTAGNFTSGWNIFCRAKQRIPSSCCKRKLKRRSRCSFAFAGQETDDFNPDLQIALLLAQNLSILSNILDYCQSYNNGRHQGVQV